MTNTELDYVLEQYDKTTPKLQREIIAKIVEERLTLMVALTESVKLQSHYATLLNSYDMGNRRAFTDYQEWIDRLIECGTLPRS